jgi:hypothetical protein
VIYWKWINHFFIFLEVIMGRDRDPHKNKGTYIRFNPDLHDRLNKYLESKPGFTKVEIFSKLLEEFLKKQGF